MLHSLLIATVGGSPSPVIASLIHYRPSKIIFITSVDSEALLPGLIAKVNSEDSAYRIEPHHWKTWKVEDPQNMETCLENLAGLEKESAEWIENGDDYEITIDFTGGTKCMSASLVLFAQNWDCKFSYVGGTQRSKNSVGIVLDGKEQIINNPNPWIYLGYQELEKIGALFNAGYFLSASSLLSESILKSHPKHRKTQLVSLRHLCDAMGAWDAFDHNRTNDEFDRLFERQNDFIRLYSNDRWNDLKPFLVRIKDWTQSISREKISLPLLSDLYMNGIRRHKESRFVDAIGRFYRCTEALAQYILFTRHNINDTARVSIDLIPKEMGKSPDENGSVKLALQDLYRFLLLSNDPLGLLFNTLELGSRSSVLGSRNKSILAHGFSIISEKTSQQFQAKLLSLLESENIFPINVIPEIPKLYFN